VKLRAAVEGYMRSYKESTSEPKTAPEKLIFEGVKNAEYTIPVPSLTPVVPSSSNQPAQKPVAVVKQGLTGFQAHSFFFFSRFSSLVIISLCSESPIYSRECFR